MIEDDPTFQCDRRWCRRRRNCNDAFEQITEQDVADAAPFTGVAATSIAVGGRNRLAVTGTDRSTDATRLRVASVGSDVTPVDGLGSADGVIRCGDSWCVLDVAAGVIRVVDLDGSLVGEGPLSAGLPAPVTDLLDLTAGDSAGTFALVQLGDGSTTILRLDA